MSPTLLPSPGQGSSADALARALLDPARCPACGAALAAARCGRCGVDLSGDAGRRVWALGHRAVLVLREREQLLGAMRSEAARTAADASIFTAARERAARGLDGRGAPARAPAQVAGRAHGRRARGPAVQSL